MEKQTNDVIELLRDPSDISDFLSALSVQPPDDPRTARRKAVSLIEELSATHAVAILFTFARKFARMVAEVSEFCRAHDAPLGGQMQLAQGKEALKLSGLDSGWAFAGPAPDHLGLDSRAHAIAASLEDVASRVSTEDLVKRTTEECVTPFGEQLKSSSNVAYRAMWREISGSTRKVERAVWAEADHRALAQAVEAVEETSGALVGVPLSAGVISALQNVEQQLPAILAELDEYELSSDAEVTPAIASLADEIQLLTAQLRALGADVSEGARVERGFHDFLRTEFWPARWRIYELWLLVRVLTTLEQSGGRLRLIGVRADVWTVPYGRAIEPVAAASFDAGDVDVYYQYWKESDDGSDMPDLVVMPKNGRAIAVIDPKHGRSYTRSKVQKVLTRYAGLDADLTAIVNYFEMPAYRFEYVEPTRGNRTWVLASEIAPDSSNARRLELRLAEALLKRGFQPSLERVAIKPVDRRRRASDTMDLLYWATETREVDEPAGLWRMTADGASVPVAGFQQTNHDSASLQAAPDGKALLILREPDVLLITLGRQPHVVAPWKQSFYTPSLGWSADGAFFALPLDGGDRLFDAGGHEISLPFPMEIVGWDPERRLLFCMNQSAKAKEEWFLLAIDPDRLPIDPDRGVLWRTKIPHKADRFSSVFGREKRAVHNTLGGGNSVVRLGDYGTYRVGRDGNLETIAEDLPFSVSPRGRSELLPGPRSSHGRILLQLRDADGTRYPLIRYASLTRDAQPALVRWTPDEERFAFTTLQSRDSPRRLYVVRRGERYARSAALPGQEPVGFAWASSRIWA